MLRFNPEQRTTLANALGELANLMVGALVLGQFLGGGSRPWWLVAVGALLWLALIGFGLVLLGGRRW